MLIKTQQKKIKWVKQKQLYRISGKGFGTDLSVESFLLNRRCQSKQIGEEE
jgi:hypothetical protein